MKWAVAGAAAALGGPLLAAAVNGTPQWDVFELTLKGPADGNPFRDVRLSAIFTQGARQIEVAGFYDGDGLYRVRFMPDTVGAWSYVTRSSARPLDGKHGRLTCTAPAADVHGPVRVRAGHHFGYADGTPFYPFGTTSYAWIHQSDAMQRQTLNALKHAPFNKIRMCIFPKSYEFNTNEPPFYPFVRDPAGKSDFTHPNPAFFHHLEQRLLDLQALGIEADLILFHPYDRWGYATMLAQDDDAYLRYVLARLGAFRHIWWSLANEWDFMKAKTKADFDRFFHIVEREDPFSHLRSIHNGKQLYDYGASWVTHASIQGDQYIDKTGEFLADWRKPVVFDEVQYEGNLNRRWGNLSGEEMTWRFWRGVIRGAYVTHGETILDLQSDMSEAQTPAIWWSTGGTLKGQSPARIAFLRRLVEDTAALGGAAGLAGLEAERDAYYDNARVVCADGTVAALLWFTDTHAAAWYDFPLPDGRFRAELIDPWAMSVTQIPGVFSGKSKVRLPGKAYQAIRFIAV